MAPGRDARSGDRGAQLSAPETWAVRARKTADGTSSNVFGSAGRSQALSLAPEATAAATFSAEWRDRHETYGIGPGHECRCCVDPRLRGGSWVSGSRSLLPRGARNRGPTRGV